jgi:AraC family transcriptional regulator of adaptative response / DNA-3-methyladenine glycosylase II
MAGAPGAAGGLILRVPAGRPPLDVEVLLRHLAPRVIPGVEELDGPVYRRVLRLPGGTGIAAVTLRPRGARGSLALTDHRDARAARTGLRRLLGLDAAADPVAADEVLARDPLLAPLVATAPAIRVPGTPDGAELAIRAVLGQQISVVAARTAAAGLAAGLGTPVEDGGRLAHAFPAPERIADAPDALLRMPRARQAAVRGLARALADGRVDARPGDPVGLRASLCELPGIGPWTAEYVAMRAGGDADAFPVTDLGILRGAAAAGLPSDARGLAARAESWRPFRAYAAQRLWSV